MSHISTLNYLINIIEKRIGLSLSDLSERGWGSMYFASETHLYIFNRLRVLNRCQRLLRIGIECNINTQDITNSLYASKIIYDSMYWDDDGSAWHEFESIADEFYQSTGIKKNIDNKYIKKQLDDRTSFSNTLNHLAAIGNSSDILDALKSLCHYENSNPVAIAARAVFGGEEIGFPYGDFFYSLYNRKDSNKFYMFIYSFFIAYRDGSKILPNNTLNALKNKINNNEQIIEFFSFKSNTDIYYSACIGAKSGNQEPIRINIIKACPDKIIKKTSKLLENGHINKDISIYLGKKLIADTINNLENQDTLIISASPLLRNLPIDALILNKNFIGLKHPIIYSNSSPLLITKPAKTDIFDKAYAIGGCDYDLDIGYIKNDDNYHALSGNSVIDLFDFLPGSLEEANILSDYGAIPITDTNAVKKNILSLEDISLLHIASHAFFEPMSTSTLSTDILSSPPSVFGGVFSSIALSGTNLGINSSNQVLLNKDGLLSIPDIIKLSFNDNALVVLSCCDTGVSEIDTVGGHIGLREAFSLAGATWVISTSWPINDKTAALFFKLFYKKINNTGNISQSFYNAKLELSNLTSHNDWAAFTLFLSTQGTLHEKFNH